MIKTSRFPMSGLFMITMLLFIISFTAGCKKEPTLLLNSTEITLKPNETFSLVVSPDATGCLFTSDNDYIAQVYASGLIMAKLVGETNISVTNAQKGFYGHCKVTVTPEYTMYKEPYLSFGKQKIDIKSFETRQVVAENDSTIFYTGENAFIDSLIYSFKNNLYSSCRCVIPGGQSNLVVNYMTERYVYLGTPAVDMTARMTTDSKTYVVTQKYSSTKIYVYYFPKTASKGELGSILKVLTGLGKDIAD